MVSKPRQSIWVQTSEPYILIPAWSFDFQVRNIHAFWPNTPFPPFPPPPKKKEEADFIKPGQQILPILFATYSVIKQLIPNLSTRKSTTIDTKILSFNTPQSPFHLLMSNLTNTKQGGAIPLLLMAIV